MTITAVDTRVDTVSEMLAALELSHAGRPFAEALSRAPEGFDRFSATPHQYRAPLDGGLGPAAADPSGAAAAVDADELARTIGRFVAFESGAGTALAHAGALDPENRGGDGARLALAGRIAEIARAVHALGVAEPAPDGGLRPGPHVPSLVTPLSATGAGLGWPGAWPTLHPFVSFVPTVQGGPAWLSLCTVPLPADTAADTTRDVPGYECDASPFHLAQRGAQSTRTLGPGASGWSAWLYATLFADATGAFHDAEGVRIPELAPDQWSRAGQRGNDGIGRRADGSRGRLGTYLGEDARSGLYAGLHMVALDAMARDFLHVLATSDAHALNGFHALSAVTEYDHGSPLAWTPGALDVVELPDVPSGFPRVAQQTLREPYPALFDLLGMLGGFAQAYADTDAENAVLGGTPSRASWFDGDPFPSDDPAAPAQDTPHDRFLALARLTFVNLDRIYTRPDGVFASTVGVRDGRFVRGQPAGAVETAYTLAALRTLRNALAARLPAHPTARHDTRIAHTPFDHAPLHPPSGERLASERITTLIEAHGRMLLEQLTTRDGVAFERWNPSTSRAEEDGALEAHCAAVRGLLEAWLATSDVRYRERAERVWERIDRDFWDDGAQLYVPVRRTGEAFTVTWSAHTFAVWLGALRTFHLLVASHPGKEALARTLEARFGRTFRVVMDGWDDRNGDGVVEWPLECLRVTEGLPRGGLRMAERVFTGESGHENVRDTSDRDHDCVPEVDDALLPAILAREIRLSVR